MKESEVKEFFRLYHKLDNILDKIFSKLDDAGLLSDAMYRPRYEGIYFDECDDKSLVIKYSDSIDNSTDIEEIPLEVIYEEKIDEYVENRKKEHEEYLKRLEQLQKERQLAKEKAEYERLKAKFEK